MIDIIAIHNQFYYFYVTISNWLELVIKHNPVKLGYHYPRLDTWVVRARIQWLVQQYIIMNPARAKTQSF